MVLTSTFPVLNHALGAAKKFWLYAGIGGGGFRFIHAGLPETKGKILEDIERFVGLTRSSRPETLRHQAAGASVLL